MLKASSYTLDPGALVLFTRLELARGLLDAFVAGLREGGVGAVGAWASHVPVATSWKGPFVTELLASNYFISHGFCSESPSLFLFV